MKTRQSSKPRAGSSRAAIIPVIEEIELSDDSDSDDDKLPKSFPVATPGVDLTETDPNLISTLVKEHCIFCLTRKTRTIFSIGGTSTSEQIDGYELLRKYYGCRTSDYLNDVFDAIVFTNKSLLTAEFPAPLLCEKCVQIVRELSDLHKKLEFVQVKILQNVRNVRKIIKENCSFIKTQEQPSDRRLEFENELLDSCIGNQETTEVILGILDKFQDLFEDETHDQIEIHLEHLEQINSFSVDGDDQLDAHIQSSTSSKSTATTSTQTDAEDEDHYNVNIIKVSVESDDEAPDLPPSSPAYDDDAMDNEFNNEYDESPGSPQETVAGVEDVKPDVLSASVNQPLSPAIDNDNPAGHGSPASVDPTSEMEVRPASSCSNSSVPVSAKAPMVIKQTGNGISIVRDKNSNSSVVSVVKEKTTSNEKSLVNSTKDMQAENLNKNEADSLKGNSAENQEKPINERRKSKINMADKKRKRQISEDESDSETEETSSESEDSFSSNSGSDSSEEDSSSDDDNLKRRRKSGGREMNKSKSRTPSSGKRSTAVDSLPFKCGLCKQLFSKRTHVYRHIRNIHHREPLREVSISCMKCKFECDNMSKLRNHMKKAHQIELPSPPKPNKSTLQCEICGFSKDRLRLFGFIDHLREHENAKKSISCKDCLQKFTTNQMYQLHPCPQAGRPPGSVAVLIENYENIRKENEYNCRFCTEETFYSEKSLQRHFKTSHEDSKPFLCDLCKDEDGFKSRNALKSHMIEKHGAMKFKCRICEDGKEEFMTFDDYHVHLTFTHFGGYFACPDCSKRFCTRDELESHKTSHSVTYTGDLYPCRICRRPLKSVKTLKQHLLVRHGIEKDDGEAEANETDQPTQQTQSTTKKSHPFSYRPKKNGGAKPFVCSLCDYNCCTSKLYRRHMQNDHGILLERKINTRTYQCDICDYTSSTVRIKGFVQHLMEHETSHKKFTCEDCFGRFSTKQLYQIHQCPQIGKLPGTVRYMASKAGNKSENKVHTCRYCGTEFNSEKAIQKHCVQEHDANAYFCDLCGPGKNMSFSSNNSFKSHMITTHNAVPYKCRMCVPTKVFTKFFDIFSHANIEHLGCSYECPHCGRKYAEKKKLENHMSTHSDAKEHICNVCGSALKSIASLRRHIRMFHSSSPKKHMCEYCSKEFLERGNLKKHIKAKHENEVEEEITTTPTKKHASRPKAQTPPSTPVARKRRRI